jgi:hypothetical protein
LRLAEPFRSLNFSVSLRSVSPPAVFGESNRSPQKGATIMSHRRLCLAFLFAALLSTAAANNSAQNRAQTDHHCHRRRVGRDKRTPVRLHEGLDPVYLQVYNSGIDQTTLRPSVDVDYVLLKDGKELRKQTEDWIGMSEAGQRLTLARLLDTTDLAPGQYDLQVRIHDHVTGQILTPATKFTIVNQ